MSPPHPLQMTCAEEESQSQLPSRPAAAAAPSKREPQRSWATVANITTPVPAAAMRHLQLSGWYWGSLTASDARQMLRQSAEGTFLVRDSTHPDYLFTLSVKTSRGPTNVRIECAGGKFSLDSAFVVRPKVLQFDDVVGLVQFYVGASQLEAAAAAAAAAATGPVGAAAAAPTVSVNIVGAANSPGAAATVNNVGAASIFNDTAVAAAGVVNTAVAVIADGSTATAAVDAAGGASGGSANPAASDAATSTAGDGGDRPVSQLPPPPRQPEPPPAAAPAAAPPPPETGLQRPSLPREAERGDGEAGGGRDAMEPTPPQRPQQPQQQQPPPLPLPLMAPLEIMVPEDGAAAALPRAAASVQLKLTRPYYSTAPTLQHLSRTVINRNARSVAQLPLPGRLKDYLCEYPYRL